MSRRQVSWFGLLVVIALGLTGLIPRQSASTTVLIVRHAEKQGSGDSDLTEAGEARAVELAHVLEQVELTAIYTSTLKRTMQTADPVEASFGITASAFPPGDIDAVVQDIVANHSGGAVLIVGHSNTMGQFVHALGGPETDDLDERNYDDLYIVEHRGPRDGKLTVLQFGAATPVETVESVPTP